MPDTSPTVLILLSDKRSGSTIFQEEICRHPDIRRVAHSPHTYEETHHWLKAAVLLRRPARLFAEARPHRGYGRAANARTYMIDTIRGNCPDFTVPDTDRALVFDGWEALCDAFARPVMFEKSPQVLAHWAALSLLLEWRAQTRLRVRIVGLVRNPMAVQYSATRLFGSDPDLRQFAWIEAQRNLLALSRMLPPEEFLLLRYEDMVQDPAARFAKVLRFAGLPHDPGIGATVSPGSLTRWREDPAFTHQPDTATAQMAAAFGYAAEDLHNPHRPGPGAAHPAPPAARFRRFRNRLRDRHAMPFLLRRSGREAPGR